MYTFKLSKNIKDINRKKVEYKKVCAEQPAGLVSAASPAYQVHVPMELSYSFEKTANLQKVYNLVLTGLTKVLAADRILIFLRNRPH